MFDVGVGVDVGVCVRVRLCIWVKAGLASGFGQPLPVSRWGEHIPLNADAPRTAFHQPLRSLARLAFWRPKTPGPDRIAWPGRSTHVRGNGDATLPAPGRSPGRKTEDASTSKEAYALPAQTLSPATGRNTHRSPEADPDHPGRPKRRRNVPDERPHQREPLSSDRGR